MQSRRMKLDEILRGICPNVYFNPPESIKMTYPCIIYKRSVGNTAHADNSPYIFKLNYQITILDKDPDSKLIKPVAMIPGCRYDRHYKADKINHDVFDIYF